MLQKIIPLLLIIIVTSTSAITVLKENYLQGPIFQPFNTEFLIYSQQASYDIMHIPGKWIGRHVWFTGMRKLDENGWKIWGKNFGNIDYHYCIYQGLAVPDGLIAAVDLYFSKNITKFDINGDSLWNLEVSFDIEDVIDIKQGIDSSFIIFGGFSGVIQKISNDGDSLWLITLNPNNDYRGRTYATAVGKNNYFSFAKFNKTKLYNINKNGQIQWTKDFDENIKGISIATTDEDGCQIILQDTIDTTLTLTRYSSSGDVEWEYPLGKKRWANVLRCFDNNYLIITSNSPDFTGTNMEFIKVNKNKEIIWSDSLVIRYQNSSFKTYQNDDTTYTIFPEDYGSLLVNLDDLVDNSSKMATNKSFKINSKEKGIQISGFQEFNGEALVSIFKANGKEVYQKNYRIVNNSLFINHSLPMGFYLLKIKNNNKEFVRSIVIRK